MDRLPFVVWLICWPVSCELVEWLRHGSARRPISARFWAAFGWAFWLGVAWLLWKQS